MIIGITGRSGTGKSYLSEILAKELDMLHIDIDKISHEVLSFDETKQFLKAEFGDDIFDNEKVNRKRLGSIVFENQEKLDKINNFCQLLIEQKLDEIISSTTKPIILDYALLAKLKQFKNCDLKILLHCDLETRYNRVYKRENISRDYFILRDSSIEDLDESSFDIVFNNITDTDISNLVKIIKAKIN